MSAGFLILAIAVPTLAADFDLPALPARLALQGGGGLCGSKELRSELAYRFLRVVDVSQPYDIMAACESSSDELVLKLSSVNGAGIAKFTVDRSPGSEDAHTAFIAASAVAKDAEVIRAALDIYLYRNANLADAGARELYYVDRPDQASEYLAQALESDLAPATLYFGLYQASAKLGRPEQAKWYLEAFLKASGHKAKDLTDGQVKPLIAVTASGNSGRAAADADFKAYESFAKAHQWHSALYRLKAVVAAAPWYEPAYVALAQSYDRIGWKPLVAVWRARAVFVRDLNKDADLGRSIEERLDAFQ